MSAIPNDRSTSTIRLEVDDPWNGGPMRMPIGVFATIRLTNDADSVLTKGWRAYVERYLRLRNRKKAEK
jgi:hypothetical protein